MSRKKNEKKGDLFGHILHETNYISTLFFILGVECCNFLAETLMI